MQIKKCDRLLYFCFKYHYVWVWVCYFDASAKILHEYLYYFMTIIIECNSASYINNKYKVVLSGAKKKKIGKIHGLKFHSHESHELHLNAFSKERYHYHIDMKYNKNNRNSSALCMR